MTFLDTICLTAEAGVDLSGQRFVQLEIQSKVLAGRPWPFTTDRLCSLVWFITPASPPSPELCCGLLSAHTERGFLSFRSSSDWVRGSRQLPPGLSSVFQPSVAKQSCARSCLCPLPPAALPPPSGRWFVLPCWFFHQCLLHPWYTLLLAPAFLCPVLVMFCCLYNAQVFLLLCPWKVGQPQKLMH